MELPAMQTAWYNTGSSMNGAAWHIPDPWGWVVVSRVIALGEAQSGFGVSFPCNQCFFPQEQQLSSSACSSFSTLPLPPSLFIHFEAQLLEHRHPTVQPAWHTAGTLGRAGVLLLSLVRAQGLGKRRQEPFRWL